MSTGRITELRLTAFKSYADEVLPLEPLTLLIGRNGSGKSNALDALEILSRLARGDEVRDAIEGNRGDAAPVRGGLDGSAPHGRDTFELGVTLETEASREVTLDVTVQVRPTVQVVSERLCAYVAHGRWRTLVDSEEHDPHRADLDATVWNGSKGRNPRLTFRSSHLLTAQLPLRIAGRTAGERELLAVAESALGVLGGVFHLDPVPHLADFLRSALGPATPWVVSGASWDADFLTDLLDGETSRPGLVEFATAGVGSGDASILLELQRYRERADLPSALPVRLWTLDVDLGAYA